jgi:hypothetical protein
MFLLNLTRMEIGLILVELSILISLLILLFWIHRSIRSLPPLAAEGVSGGRRIRTGEMEKLGQLLRESQSISRQLSKNIEEKKEITQRVLKGLDERIQALGREFQRADHRPEVFASSRYSEKDVYTRALEMSSAGANPTEIARALRLPKGEAQLIYDLQRYSR